MNDYCIKNDFAAQQELAAQHEGRRAVSSNALFAKLISDIEGIASNVANCSTDSQASDDCATICQMIQDFKANDQRVAPAGSRTPNQEKL